MIIITPSCFSSSLHLSCKHQSCFTGCHRPYIISHQNLDRDDHSSYSFAMKKSWLLIGIRCRKALLTAKRTSGFIAFSKERMTSSYGLTQRLILSGSQCWFSSTNPRSFNCYAKHPDSLCCGNGITWITCFSGLLCMHCKAILCSRIFSSKYFWLYHYSHLGESSMSSIPVFIHANIHCAARGSRSNLEFQDLL